MNQNLLQPQGQNQPSMHQMGPHVYGLVSCLPWCEDGLDHQRTAEPPKSSENFVIICDMADCRAKNKPFYGPSLKLICFVDKDGCELAMYVHVSCYYTWLFTQEDNFICPHEECSHLNDKDACLTLINRWYGFLRYCQRCEKYLWIKRAEDRHRHNSADAHFRCDDCDNIVQLIDQLLDRDFPSSDNADSDDDEGNGQVHDKITKTDNTITDSIFNDHGDDDIEVEGDN